MNILSLFDGMSCGRIALERAGVEVDNYFASEVDKYAIKVTMANYPDTIQLGDVRKVSVADIPKIDLLIGGSPCQGFSQAGKGEKFNDSRSALFWEYMRILKECRERNPDILFLLENVRMDKYSEGVISDALGIDPVCINSALVSAQNRERLYWSNIRTEVHTMFGHERTAIPQPEDKGILLKDILETPGVGAIKNMGEIQERSDKALNIDDNYWKGIDNHGQRTLIQTSGRKSEKAHQRRLARTKGLNQKADALLASSWKGMAANGCTNIVDQYTHWRKLTPLECERLQTVPDFFTAYVSNTQRYKMLGNGWTVDVIAHIFSFLPEKFFRSENEK